MKYAQIRIFMLSQPHGANRTKRQSKKIDNAASRNAALSVIVFDNSPFQIRQTAKPNRAITTGPQMPKFTNQNSRNGLASSSPFAAWTHPGCQARIDPARNSSVVNQTKSVAGRTELTTSASACLLI